MNNGPFANIVSAIIALLRPYASGNQINADLPLLDAARPQSVLPTSRETLGSRGATPLHYRAFSLLQARVTDSATGTLLHGFRQRARTIKLVDDEMVRDEALRLMSHFAELVDQYVPLHDDAEKHDQPALEAKLAGSIRRLDQALDYILSRAGSNADSFDTAVRFVKLRYDPETVEEPFQLCSI